MIKSRKEILEAGATLALSVMILFGGASILAPAASAEAEAPITADLFEYPTDGVLEAVENADETCAPFNVELFTDEGLDYFLSLGWQGIAGDHQEAIYHPDCL